MPIHVLMASWLLVLLSDWPRSLRVSRLMVYWSVAKAGITVKVKPLMNASTICPPPGEWL
ncbi:hypothetical protein D3C78_1512370 [compost metagenome]